MSYTTVHEAFKLLKNLGLVQLVDKTTSDKKVEKHIYQLNLEGLLWLFVKHAFFPKSSKFADIKFSQLKELKNMKTSKFIYYISWILTVLPEKTRTYGLKYFLIGKSLSKQE